jgi:23S rRNA (guanosine2251-2'-O)-methyltransferase
MKKMRIVLDNIRSAWNVGAILRTCDAIGADLILVGYTPKPIGKTLKMIKKTSIGSEEWVNWESYDHYQQVLDKYSEGVHLAIEINQQSNLIYNFLKNDLPEIKVQQKELYIWFGNEIHGLQPNFLTQLAYVVHLPMLGKKESLNVASTVCAVGYLILEHL